MKIKFLTIVLSSVLSSLFAEEVRENFMTENWSQTAPYNNLVPAYLPAGSEDGEYQAKWQGHVVAGCVATAMAQTMHYWQWPRQFDDNIIVDHSVNIDKGKFQFNVEHAIPRGVPLVYADTSESQARVTFVAATLGELAFDRDGTGGYVDRVVAKLIEKGFYVRPTYYDESLKWDLALQMLKFKYPVPATIPTHAVVLDGWKRVDGVLMYHLNNGQGGSGDQWVTRDKLSNVYPCFPRKIALIKKLPARSQLPLKIEWYFPEGFKTIYPDEFEGFDLVYAPAKSENRQTITLGRDVRSYSFEKLDNGVMYDFELTPRFKTLDYADPSYEFSSETVKVTTTIDSSAPATPTLTAPKTFPASLTGCSFKLTGSETISSIGLTTSLKRYTSGKTTYNLADYVSIEGEKGDYTVNIKPIDFLQNSDNYNVVFTFTGDDSNGATAYAETIVNFSAANTGTVPEGGEEEEEDEGVGEEGKYVLISPPAYVKEWQDYLTMRKEQRPKVTFKLKNAADIYKAYPFDPANQELQNGAPRNPAESIHAWIRAEMKDVPTADRGKYYFVLGGSFVNAQAITSADDDRLQTKIPSVYIQPRHAGSVNLIDEHQDHPVSDMFYACLDVAEGKWPWDSNANGKYADTNELGNNQNDFYADVIIARIPIDKHPKAKPSDVIAAFTEKVRRVEAGEFEGNYHFAAAGGQVAQTFNMKKNPGRVVREEREFYDGGLNYFDPRHGGQWIDAEELPRRTVKDMVTKRRPVLEGNPLFVYGWGADHASIDAAVSHYYSHDRDFVEYRDHGSGEDLYCKYINVDRYLNATGITRMIFSGFSCMTGHLDSNYLSLGEAEIESLKGGTVASVHNSRFGFGTNNVNNDDDGLSSSLQYYMKDAVLNMDMDMGSAWLDARHRYYNRGSAYPVGRFCLAEQILFGDPLIKLPPAIGDTTIEDAAITVEKDTGYTTLNVKGDATISGDKLFKVMQRLKVTSEGDLTFAADGGVGGEGVNFAAEKGTLTIASPKKSYFAMPTGADEVVIAGNGATLDFDTSTSWPKHLTLVGDGAKKTGNILRGRNTKGKLATYLPLAVTNTEVALGTVDAFNGAKAETFASVSNGGLGITFNPNYGLNDSWEYFTGSISLDNGKLYVDRTETSGFGRPDKPGLTVSVSGNSSVKTMNGGKATLFGTSTFNLADGATLNLAATFVSDTATNGRIVVSGGRTVVADGYGLSGEVEVNDGTLVLNELPLRNVTKLSLSGKSKLVIPMDDGGYSQVLSAKGASLEISDETQVSALGKEEDAIDGKVTTNGSCFDLSKFMVWDGNDGNGWTAEWMDGKKVYFPEIEEGGEVIVNIPNELSCAFIAFGNENGTYRFKGARINLGSAVLSENVVFENEVYVATSTLVSGKESQFATLITPSLQIQDGAVVSAMNIANEIKTIKGIRFYPLKTNGGDGKSVALHELQFNSEDGKLAISSGFSYSDKTCSVSGQGCLWDGVNSVVDYFQNISCYITANSKDDLEKGRVYLQFMFNNPQKVITSLGLASSGYPGVASAKSVTDFRVDVTSDGENWVTIFTKSNASVPASGGWYGSSDHAFSVSVAPTAISIASGGSLVLKGELSAKITLEEGAKLKAIQDKSLTLGAGSKIVVPETGYAVIDVSDLKLENIGKDGLTVLSGITLTADQLSHLTTRGQPYLNLEVAEVGGVGVLKLVVRKKPPKILFR